MPQDSTVLIGIGKAVGGSEATKNEEFEPDQLKLWVEILKKLEEIAGERMPSIAALLAQAADAPGQTGAIPPPDPSKSPQGSTGRRSALTTGWQTDRSGKSR